MAVAIPLFPLNAVLFPHMPLALHIFEQRYRDMMRDCTEQGTTFGVLAIRQGVEVGGGAVPYRVGTLAQMREVELLDDGRYNLVVAGASRFRVQGFSSDRSYLTGEVTYLEDAAATSRGAALATLVAADFRRYQAQLSAASQEQPPELELPDDPELLSYIVAASMQVSTADRQSLLEIDAADDRLRALLPLLRREHVLLEHMLGRSVTAAAAFSPN